MVCLRYLEERDGTTTESQANLWLIRPNVCGALVPNALVAQSGQSTRLLTGVVAGSNPAGRTLGSLA